MSTKIVLEKSGSGNFQPNPTASQWESVVSKVTTDHSKETNKTIPMNAIDVESGFEWKPRFAKRSFVHHCPHTTILSCLSPMQNENGMTSGEIREVDQVHLLNVPRTLDRRMPFPYAKRK